MRTFKKRKTVKFSGRMDSYEDTCQIMLVVGEEWLKNKPLSIWKKDSCFLKKKFKDKLNEKWLKELK